MRLAELLNREVITESGHRLGHVHDIRGELSEGRLRVTGLVVGRRGILERYGFGTRGRRPRPADLHGRPIIPWERVARVGANVVVLEEDDDED